MPNPRKITGLSEIVDRYDGFLFDIYGVVHNGEKCFPDVVDCLRHLKGVSKPYAFLSNMPRRAAIVSDALIRHGMPPELASRALTSGEAVYRALSQPGFGPRYYFQGPEQTRDVIPDGYEPVTDVTSADFILATGIGDTETPADYTDLLQTALKRNLPMICGNPDLRVGRGSKLVSCAGLLADAYEQMGGDTRWMGKPHGAVFQMAKKMLDGKDLLMVGDSLRTDIAGANRAGLDTLFIESGIHSAESGPALFARYGVEPTHTLNRLRW